MQLSLLPGQAVCDITILPHCSLNLLGFFKFVFPIFYPKIEKLQGGFPIFFSGKGLGLRVIHPGFLRVKLVMLQKHARALPKPTCSFNCMMLLSAWVCHIYSASDVSHCIRLVSQQLCFFFYVWNF